MPILHTQLTEQGQTPDGKAIQVPSAVVLLTKGPVVQVSITIQEAPASHAKTGCNIYPIQIEISGFKIRFQAPRAIGAAVKEQDLLLLLGRDLLQVCTLFYNGPAGQITLSI